MVGNGKTLPAILGTGVPKTNNTDLQARGWELTLGWNDRLANGLSYGAKFSLYDSRTKITKYKDNPTNSIGGYMEGRYTGEIWGFETKGIAKTDKEMQDHLASLPNGGQDATRLARLRVTTRTSASIWASFTSSVPGSISAS